MKQKSGIYKIMNIVNNKIYVGSAVDLRKRKSQHFSNLKNNKHVNKHLQSSYNKHGLENFKFEILEYVKDKEMLIEREQYYIDTLNPEYNICKIAGSCLGLKKSYNVKKKISEARKGVKHSKETKNKISKALKGKVFTQEDINNVYINLNL